MFVLILWVAAAIGWAVAIFALRQFAKLRIRYEILAQRNRELQQTAAKLNEERIRFEQAVLCARSEFPQPLKEASDENPAHS